MQIFPPVYLRRIQPAANSPKGQQQHAAAIVSHQNVARGQVVHLDEGTDVKHDIACTELERNAADAQVRDENCDEHEDDQATEEEEALEVDDLPACGPRIYSPPPMYLPLPRIVNEAEKASPSSNIRKRSTRSASVHKRFKLQTSGTESKHLLMHKIRAKLPTSAGILDQYRLQSYSLYSSLPNSHTGAPILTRLRRRLLRLAGHATFAHHRGRHEVLFQTAFLFDLVILEFAKWIANNAHAGNSTAFNGLELSTFLREVSSHKQHCCSDATISRLTTSATVSDNNFQLGERMDVLHRRMGSVSKEELRTAMMACLLLASKWNNSRYVPPEVLCSSPVGRVTIGTLLDFEIAILSLFEFDIPFQTSAMNHLHLMLGTCEEDLQASFCKRLVCFSCLLILEMALCDYEALNISTENLVRSASWLGATLTQAALGSLEADIPAPETLCSHTRAWAEAVDFHMKNIEFEMKSAVAILPRLEEMERWQNPLEQPSVFGVDISRKPMNYFDLGCSEVSDARTKTESLALAHLNCENSAAFDLLAAAALAEGQRVQMRSRCEMFEKRCEVSDKLLATKKVRQRWVKMRTEIESLLSR